MKEKKTVPPIQAAALPGEYAFISAIAADLCDDTAKLVYADWLEEQGDPRAAFVRELVAAANHLKDKPKLPDKSALPRAWTNMLGAALLEGILKADLVDVAESVLRLARPIVTITTAKVKENLIPVGSSKFGGHP